MFHSNFNSIYLRPVASGSINEWDNATAAEKHWDNINDQIFFEGNTPPRADYAGFPPAEIINYTHPYIGTKDGQYAHVKIAGNTNINFFGQFNSGQVQSWMFEKPQFEGSGQLNIWMYATSLFTINNQSTNIISYSKLDNNWVPRQINKITRFDTFFNTSQTGVFRWYKIPVGVYTSGAFANFEVGLSYTNVVNSAPYPTIEAIYAEVEVNPGFPLYTLGAYPSQTGSIPLVIGRPAISAESGIPLYIEGIPYYSSGNIPLYTDAIYPVNSSIPLYIEGVPYGAAATMPFYTEGPFPVESGLDLLLYNNNPLTTGLTLYVNTYDVENSGIDLYSFGAYLSNQSIPLLIVAPTGTQGSLPLYAAGFVPTPTVSSVPLYINSTDPFRSGGWTSYNALYDYYDTYIPASKNRVRYGTPPFDSPLPYSGIYNFFRPHIASGVQYTYYDPSRAVWDNGNWSRGMFVSGVIAFGNPSGFNIAVTLPNILYDIDDATYFFTPYIPDMGDNVLSSVMHEPFTQYLEQYFDPYNLIDFKSFVDNYFETNHPAYKSSIDSWNGITVEDLAGQQTYFLTTMSGNTAIWPALPVSAYHNAVASSIAYVESLSNPHHPYTFPMMIEASNPFTDSYGWTSYNKLYDNYNYYIQSTKNRVKYGSDAFYGLVPYSGINAFFKPHNLGGVYEPARTLYVSGDIVYGSETNGYGVLLPNAGFSYDNMFFAPYAAEHGVVAQGFNNTLVDLFEEYFDIYGIADLDNFFEDYFSTNYPSYWNIINSWNGLYFNNAPGYSHPNITGVLDGNIYLRYQNVIGYNWMPVLPLGSYTNVINDTITYLESLTNPHHPYTFTLYTKGLSYPASTGMPLFAKVSINGEANVRDIEDSIPFYTSCLGIKGSSVRGIDLYLNNSQTYLPISGQFTLYVQSEQPIYGASDGVDLYLRNNLGGVYSGIPLYTANIREGVSIFDPEYFTLADDAYPLSASRTLYLHNNNQGGSLPIYLNVSKTTSGNMPMYVMGGNIGRSGIPLYTKSYGIDTDTLKLYTHGY